MFHFTACASGTFTCENPIADHFRCIPMNFICDGKHDCMDGADELNCAGKLSFFNVYLTILTTVAQWLRCWSGKPEVPGLFQKGAFPSHLKAHFMIHSPIPPFFSKKVEIFTSAEAFRYIMFVCKLFLANSIV